MGLLSRAGRDKLNTILNTKIEPRIDAYSGFNFLGCDVFSNGKSSFLINGKNGTIMLVDKSIEQKIINGDFDDDIKFKLIQRGFATVPGSNPIDDNKDEDGILPRFFFIELTKNCNLHCQYCFRDFDLVKNHEPITDQEIDKICNYIFNFCKENRLHSIFLQPWGGESLLYLDKIVRIKKFFDNTELKVTFVVQTNGTLITHEVAKVISDNDIQIGISLDGPQFLQNMQRPYVNGDSSFEDVISGVNHLRSFARNISTLSVITKNSLPVIDDMLDFFAKELDCKSVKFNVVRANEHAAENMEVLYSNIKEYIDKLLNKLISLNAAGFKIVESNIRDKLNNLLSRSPKNMCNSRGCRGGRQIVSFDKYGNIYPCELTDNADEIIGNIEDSDGLVCLINKAEQTKPYFRDKRKVACDDCSFWFFCRGGCSAAVKYIGNKNITTDIVECCINKALYPRLIELTMNNPKAIDSLLGDDL